ncbi:MAG: HD-GYP domain-containing protein [Candidatus Aquicultorales bacterium]
MNTTASFPGIRLIDLVVTLSEAVDLVNPAVADHHKQVSYAALNIARTLGVESRIVEGIVVAAMLHDIGALSTRERLSVLDFEFEKAHDHAFKGARLFSLFKPLDYLSDYIKYHHVRWDGGRGRRFLGGDVPLASHVIHLADRVCVQIDKERPILGQTEAISGKIRENAGSMFVPGLVEAFGKIAVKEAFWFDLVSPSLGARLVGEVKLNLAPFDDELILSAAKMFSQVIDFRSRFTSMHSSAVAGLSAELGRLCGRPDREVFGLGVAGFLHDIGKFAVPETVIAKAAPLTDEEYGLVKAHPYFSHVMLGRIRGLTEIQTWGSLHHEHLDGSGYPFHLPSSEIPTAARIVAVADKFSALTEDRPYRRGLDRRSVISLLKRMAGEGRIDKEIAAVAVSDYGALDELRREKQGKALERYRGFTDIAVEPGDSAA